jgi:hypothetical protein
MRSRYTKNPATSSALKAIEDGNDQNYDDEEISEEADIVEESREGGKLEGSRFQVSKGESVADDKDHDMDISRLLSVPHAKAHTSPATERTPHQVYWLADGKVVLHSGETAFKLHRSRRSKLSVWFRKNIETMVS